jgi:hypothetical protein
MLVVAEASERAAGNGAAFRASTATLIVSRMLIKIEENLWV